MMGAPRAQDGFYDPPPARFLLQSSLVGLRRRPPEVPGVKITFVLAIADLSGGVRVVSIYADRLKRRGHEVTIVVRPPRPPTLKERARSAFTGRALPADARIGP